MENKSTTEFGITLLRASLGIMFIAHGLLKVLVFTPAGTVGFFESIGYPGFFAYWVMIAEIGGGVLLLAGIYTRLVSLALLPVLAGAALVHLPNGWVFSAEGGGWEYPVFLFVVTLSQAIFGSGRYALKGPKLVFLPTALTA